MFFINPVLILLTVLGGSFPDLDHDFRRNRVLIFILLSLIFSFLLYLFNFPIYMGLILVVLGFIFLFSSHRGFTHSLFGGLLLSFLLAFILFFGSLFVSNLFSLFGICFNYSFLLVFILISLFILNKYLFPLFSVFLILYAVFFNMWNFSFIVIFLALFLGFLSHIILDSFSVSGVRVFYPFYNKKFYKGFGFVLIGVLIVFSIFHFLGVFNFFNSFLF